MILKLNAKCNGDRKIQLYCACIGPLQDLISPCYSLCHRDTVFAEKWRVDSRRHLLCNQNKEENSVLLESVPSEGNGRRWNGRIVKHNLA